MTRTDAHRPSVLDPAEYVEVGYEDIHPEEGGCWYDYETLEEVTGTREIDPYRFARTGHGDYQCQHCGQHGLRYIVIFAHRPTGDLLAVGSTCAGKLNLSSRRALEARREIERQAAARKAEAWLNADPRNRAAADFLEQQFDAGRLDEFTGSLRGQLKRNGELSDKQVAAALRSLNNIETWKQEREAEKADEPDPAPIPDEVLEGRAVITGKILSSKYRESMYGDVLKMLVLDDRGFKVWGTQPDSLEVPQPREEGGWIQHTEHDEDGKPVHRFYRPATRGDRVTFTAAVTRSDDDETFGFFKRPTNAQAITA